MKLEDLSINWKAEAKGLFKFLSRAIALEFFKSKLKIFEFLELSRQSSKTISSSPFALQNIFDYRYLKQECDDVIRFV